MTKFHVSTPDGGLLSVRRQGAGAPIVLVSGLGGTAAFWQPTIATMGAGFEFITFDQRGVGGSSRGTAQVTIAQLAQDVVTVCDACQISQASFLGHSTGGCIVQTLATNAPQMVKRLALSAAWAHPSRFMQSLFEFRLKLLTSNPQAYVESAALLSFAPEWLEQNWDHYERATRAAPHDPEKQTVISERIGALLSFDGSALVKHLPSGTLIIGAEDDMIVPAYLQRKIAAEMPDAQLELLPMGGHFYPISRKDAFAGILKDWMHKP